MVQLRESQCFSCLPRFESWWWLLCHYLQDGKGGQSVFILISSIRGETENTWYAHLSQSLPAWVWASPYPCIYEFAGARASKYQKLSGLNNRNLLSQFWRWEISRCRQGGCVATVQGQAAVSSICMFHVMVPAPQHGTHRGTCPLVCLIIIAPSREAARL